MKIIGYGLLILAVLFGFVIWVLYKSLFQSRVSYRDSEGVVHLRLLTKEELLANVANLDDDAKHLLAARRDEWKSRLPQDQFELLCVAISMATKVALADVTNRLVMAEYFDSLETVELALLIEELLGIVITDDELERILTFQDLIVTLESRGKSHEHLG